MKRSARWGTNVGLALCLGWPVLTLGAGPSIEPGRWFLTVERLQKAENQPPIETRVVCVKSAPRIGDLISDVPASCTLSDDDSDAHVLRWEVSCPPGLGLDSMRGEARMGDGEFTGTISIERLTPDGPVRYDARFEGRRTDATCTPAR